MDLYGPVSYLLGKNPALLPVHGGWAEQWCSPLLLGRYCLCATILTGCRTFLWWSSRRDTVSAAASRLCLPLCQQVDAHRRSGGQQVCRHLRVQQRGENRGINVPTTPLST